jgi:ABC-type uncharacterized transport system substrate-binding protein
LGTKPACPGGLTMSLHRPGLIATGFRSLLGGKQLGFWARKAHRSPGDSWNDAKFITLLGGTAMWPLAARAQQPALPVVGFLNNGSAEAFAPHLAAFQQGLSEAGYVDGQNVTIEYRWADGDNSRLPALVADLVGRPAALIAATGGVASALAAKSGTTTTPVVFAMGADPVRFGLVASLNRPGGNITGVSYLANTILEKQIEMLHESVSKVTAVGFLVNPSNPNAEQDMITAAAASRAFGHEPIIVKAGTEAEIDAAIAALVERRAGAIARGVLKKELLSHL